MTLFDVVLLLIIGGFGIIGYNLGLVSTIGSIIGAALGLYASSRYYEAAANWLMGITGWTGNFSRVVAFIFLFLVFNRAFGFIFWLIEKFLVIFTELPFIYNINKVLGAILGLFEGVLIVGVSVFFINKFPLWPLFMDQLSRSTVAFYCLGIASILWPLVPDTVLAVEDNVKNWLGH